MLLTEAVHSMGIFSKSLNESCEVTASHFSPSTALVFEVFMRLDKKFAEILKIRYTEIMNTITIKQRGVVTLPKKLRDSLGLAEGTILRVTTDKGNIVLEPDKKMTALDIELASAIKQSKEDLKHGRYIQFATIQEFHEKLAKYKN